MDEMDFVSPVRVGDLVHAEAQVNWTGRSSMEVGVRVLAEPWNEAGIEPVRVATAYLVFVAVDGDGRPRAVPPVLPENDDDRQRFAEAEIRRTHRLARRARHPTLETDAGPARPDRGAEPWPHRPLSRWPSRS